MSWGSLSPSRRIALVSLVVALSAAATFSQAEARARHHGKQHAKQHRVIHGPDYRPPYAEFVLDANSGDMLREVNADEPRHPASLTKIMTLYLLFEQLEAGKFKLDTPLPISSHRRSLVSRPVRRSAWRMQSRACAPDRQMTPPWWLARQSGALKRN